MTLKKVLSTMKAIVLSVLGVGHPIYDLLWVRF